MAAKLIYLDHAAATPVSPAVRRAMEPFYEIDFYNPSATYGAGRDAKRALDSARETAAQVIGARPSEIIFTAGGTEANNLAIHGVMEQYPDGHIVASSVEHDSVIAPTARYPHALTAVEADGTVNFDSLRQSIQDNTVLVSVMYANNEVGTIQPIRKIVQLVQAIRRERHQQGNSMPLYVHTDACQAANYLDVHASRLGVDMMTLNGGKIYGPKQSGLLYVKSHVRLQPLIQGGGQERGLRSGTENVAQAVGLATALSKAQKIRVSSTEETAKLQSFFFDQLEKLMPEAIVNGSRNHRLPNNVHITVPGQDNERLIFALDEKGVMVAAGSACSASNEEPSHVLRAMGVSDEDAQSSLRFTLGKTSTKEQVDFVVQTLVDIVRKSVY